IKKKVREGTLLRDKICLCDHIDTPFILGVLRPRIYLPSAMGDAQSDYVVAHENAHLKRHDHCWKPLGFLLLAIYWFNPLCWFAYALLCRDIEAACDEKVVRDWDAHDKKAYLEALLSCSVPRRVVAACPLAFAEVGVKQRVKNVLNYKKPAFWVISAAVVACVVVAVCFLTNPKSSPVSFDNI
ncbi:MAG: M56 family metallopeptidase, partial [Clostridia bacterium]|nr:M56 family metallopeptidase [Clostridia bacterium]